MTCPITIATQLKEKLSTNLDACNAKITDFTAVVASKSAEINSYQEAASVFTAREQEVIDSFVAAFGNGAWLKEEITKDAINAKLEISKEHIDAANQAIVDAQVGAVTYTVACKAMSDSQEQVTDFVTYWNQMVTEVNAKVNDLDGVVNQAVASFMNLVNPPAVSAPVSEPATEPTTETASSTDSTDSTDSTAGDVASGDLVSDTVDAATVAA